MCNGVNNPVFFFLDENKDESLFQTEMNFVFSFCSFQLSEPEYKTASYVAKGLC